MDAQVPEKFVLSCAVHGVTAANSAKGTSGEYLYRFNLEFVQPYRHENTIPQRPWEVIVYRCACIDCG